MHFHNKLIPSLFLSSALLFTAPAMAVGTEKIANKNETNSSLIGLDKASRTTYRNKISQRDRTLVNVFIATGEPLSGREEYIKSGDLATATVDLATYFSGPRGKTPRAITTQFGPGAVVDLDQGVKVVVRPGSRRGLATLEVQNTLGTSYAIAKMRYSRPERFNLRDLFQLIDYLNLNPILMDFF